MPIAIECPSCKRAHSAPDDLAGTRVKCPCGGIIQVPAQTTTASSPAAPAPAALKVQCPNCQREHSVGAELAGTRAQCGCGQIIEVPAASGPSPNVAATQAAPTQVAATQAAATQVSCPACGRQHNVPPELAGKMAQCPCGQGIQIPHPGAGSPAAAAPLDAILGDLPDPTANDPLGSPANLGGPLRSTTATSRTGSAGSSPVLHMVGAGGALFCLLLAVVGAAMTWVTVDAAVNSGITNPEAKGFQIRLGGLGTAVKRDDSGVAIGESLKLGADRPIGVMLIAISLVACIGTVVWGLGFGPLEAQLSGPLRERIGIAIAGVALVLVVLYVAWIGKAVAMSRAMHDAQHTADGFHSWTTAPGIGLYLGAGGALVALVIVSAVVRRISEGGLWLRLGELGGLLVGGLLVVVVVTPWDGSVLWSQLSLWEAASGDIESPAVTKKRLAKLRADLGDYRSNKGRFSDPEEKAKFLEELNRTRDEYRAMAGPDARPLFVSR